MPPAIRRCYRVCSTRLVRTKSLPVSVVTARAIQSAAIMRSRGAAHTPLFRHEKMVSSGRTIDRALRLVMTYCMPCDALVVGYGRSGGVTIGAVWWKPKMRCFKLLGERVIARDFDRQDAELQMRAAILNRFTLLGTPTTVAMHNSAREKGYHARSLFVQQSRHERPRAQGRDIQIVVK